MSLGPGGMPQSRRQNQLDHMLLADLSPQVQQAPNNFHPGMAGAPYPSPPASGYGPNQVYGAPPSRRVSSSSSHSSRNFFNGIRRKIINGPGGGGGGDGFDDDDDGAYVDPGRGTPDIGMSDISGLRDRDRYPMPLPGGPGAAAEHGRTMSMSSTTSGADTTPIIPTLRPANVSNQAYRKNLTASRQQAMAGGARPGPNGPSGYFANPGYLPPPPGSRSMPRLRSMTGPMNGPNGPMNGPNGPMNGYGYNYGSVPTSPSPEAFEGRAMSMSSQVMRPGSRMGSGGPRMSRPPQMSRDSDSIMREEELTGKIKLLQDRVAELEAQQELPSAEPDVDAKSGLVANPDLETQLLAYKARVAELEAGPSSSDLEQQLDQHKQRIAQLEANQADPELESQLMQYRQRITQLESMEPQLAAHRDRIAELEAEHKGQEELKAQLLTHKDRIAQLEQGHERLVSEQIRAHTDRISELEQDNERLASQESERAENQQKLAEYETRHPQLEQELLLHKQRLAEYETSHPMLEQELSVLKHRLAALELAPPTDQQATALQDMNRSLLDEIRLVTSELADAVRRELGLQSAVESDDSSTSSSERHDQSLQRAQKVIDLQRQLDLERRLRLEAFGGLVSPSSEANAKLIQELAQAQHACHTHELEYAALHEQHEQLKRQFAELELEIDDLKNGIVPELRSHVQDLETLTAAGNPMELIKQIEDLKVANRQMEKLLDEQSTRGPLGDKIKAVESQRDALREALRTLRERKDQEITQHRDRVRQLEVRLEKEHLVNSQKMRRFQQPALSLLANGPVGGDPISPVGTFGVPSSIPTGLTVTTSYEKDHSTASSTTSTASSVDTGNTTQSPTVPDGLGLPPPIPPMKRRGYRSAAPPSIIAPDAIAIPLSSSRSDTASPVAFEISSDPSWIQFSEAMRYHEPSPA